MAGRPDLRTYHLLHRGMRNDMARLHTAVTRLSEAGGRPRVTAIGRWYAGFLGEFRHHHTVEDEMFFPALATDFAPFAAQIVRLDDEHHRP